MCIRDRYKTVFPPQIALFAAVASAAALPSYGYGAAAYAGPAHYGQPSFVGLTQHYNGAVVPIEPAAVQAARADHLRAKAAYGGW